MQHCHCDFSSMHSVIRQWMMRHFDSQKRVQFDNFQSTEISIAQALSICTMCVCVFLRLQQQTMNNNDLLLYMLTFAERCFRIYGSVWLCVIEVRSFPTHIQVPLITFSFTHSMQKMQTEIDRRKGGRERKSPSERVENRREEKNILFRKRDIDKEQSWVTSHVNFRFYESCLSLSIELKTLRLLFLSFPFVWNS